jgi:hypothetical protein
MRGLRISLRPQALCSAFLGSIIGTLLAVGCASAPQAIPTEREGLLDRMVKLQPANLSTELASRDRGHARLVSEGDEAPASRTSKKTFLQRLTRAAGIESAGATSVPVKARASGPITHLGM